MTRIRVLVVDDEPIAREGLVKLLAQDAELEMVGTCEDGDAAIEAIARLDPQLVFLDVQMPELDGFGVIRAIGAESMPAVIFVTAFDQHAVQAFDVAAVDYVLKPFDNARLADAVRRGKARVRAARPDGESAIDRLLRAADRRDEREQRDYPRRIAIREAGRIRFVAVREIDWVEGADYYSRLHAGGRTYLLRETMTSLAARLDPSRFFRTHRSAIVNLERVREIQQSLRGEGTVVLTNGAKVRLARGRRDLLASALEHGTARL